MASKHDWWWEYMEWHGMTEMDYTRVLVMSTPHVSCSPVTARLYSQYSRVALLVKGSSRVIHDLLVSFAMNV